TLRYVGSAGRFVGRYVRAAAIAAWTSRAAPLMSRPRSNCSVTFVEPRALVDVISVTPAMRVNWRSSGVATVAAMISALAPGRLELTLIVGKSTCGSGDTGSTANATRPTSTTAADNRIVATGRRMNGS